MSQNESSLLFRLRGDSSGARAAVNETRQAIAQLRTSSVADLRQIQTASTTSLGAITQSVGQLAASVPFVGRAVNGLTAQFTTMTFATEGAAAGVTRFIGPVGAAVAAIGLWTSAIVKVNQELFTLVHNTAEFQGKLFDLSLQTGVSVETLSALEVVARTTGSSIESLVQSLGIFQRRLEEAQEPGTKAAEIFKRLGVDALDTETALRQTIASLARMPEGFRQTALALEVFGRGGKAFLAIAKESKGDIDDIIRRLTNLGLITTEQAKLADEFNDQLVLLQIQFRGLGTQAIPVVLGALKQLSDTLAENRELFNVLQNIVKAFVISVAIPLRAAIVTARTAFEGIQFVLRTTAEFFERIKAAVEFIVGHPVTFPSIPKFLSPADAVAATPPGVAVPTKDPNIERLENEINARKRLQGVLNFAFAERQRLAEDEIALAQRELDAGKRTRQELVDVTIDGTRKQTRAEIDALEVERAIKLREQALAKDDVDKRTQLSNAILTIDKQIADKRADQIRGEADLRAKARLEEQKAELASQQRQLETLAELGEQRITAIEEQMRREVEFRAAGLEEIEKIENAALAARGQLLKRELELAGVGPERQAALDKIAAIEAERTALEQRQSQRRIEIAREELEVKREILQSTIDTSIQIEQIKGQALIETIQALAERRVKTEERAAREILAVRLGLIDDEIEATKAKLEAAAGISDASERARVQAELTNQIRVLNAEREAIQEDGERRIEEGRQRDLENERRYAEELKEIKERVRDTERDAARAVLDLMRIHFASRRDIIRQRLRLDIEDENARHRQALETIRNLEQENRESNKTEHEKLEAEQEINLLREAEAERHQLAMQGIKDQAKQDEEEATPLGRLGLDIENLKEFASVIEDSIVPLGEILTRTFQQVADAIGQTVANWVLLGETGPAVMRKILAQALASIAAEAAVNAIKELALGFATLFFNPAESAAHFTAAGLWASIGVGSALAGRAVAGDLFKSKPGAGGGGSSDGRTGELNPLNLARNAGPGSQPQIAPQIQPIKLIIEHRVNDGKFAKAITSTVVEDINNAGPIREVIGGDGNLNRG